MLGDPLLVASLIAQALEELGVRLGDETSERQWSDVLGILKIQGDRLEHGYLDEWAEPLGVGDLLARARQDSRPR
ncbi:MAG: hypothetical protein HYZ29_36880 [Myxococcales bacterium]|nr:hypothetical protein [Myxococcales bacterium]